MSAARSPRTATCAMCINPQHEDDTTRKRAITVSRALACCAALLLAGAIPSDAADPSAPTLDGVIGATRLWAFAILAALATLMLTVAGILYTTAGGNPTQIEKAKGAFKSALGGYALAALAPLLVTAVKSLVGAP